MSAISNAEGLDNSRPFRLWLDSGSDQIEAVTGRVYDAIGGTESIRQKRSLALRHLKVVLLNLLTIAARDVTRYCAYSRTRDAYPAKSRYNPLHISPGMIEVVDALAKSGLIEHRPGFLDRTSGIGRLSRMRPTDKLLALVDIQAAELPALITCPAKMESIKLYPPKVKGVRKAAIEYEDTDETHRMRGVLTAYNEMLQRTDITLAMDPADVKLLGHDVIIRPCISPCSTACRGSTTGVTSVVIRTNSTGGNTRHE